MGEGRLPGDAVRELELRATAAGTTQYRMADLILSTTTRHAVDVDDAEPVPD